MEPHDPTSHAHPVCEDSGGPGGSASWEPCVLVQRAYHLAGSLWESVICLWLASIQAGISANGAPVLGYTALDYREAGCPGP